VNRTAPQRSILNRRLLRFVRRSWLRLTAISTIMAIGVACFVGLSTTWRNLVRGQNDFYRQCRMADFSVELTRLPLADLATISPIPGVVELQSRIVTSAIVDLPDSLETINGLVLSLPEDPEPTINGVMIMRGSYFTPDRRDQVLVNDAFSRRHGLDPGDRLHLVLHGQQRTFVVVGTASSSEFMYLVPPETLAPDPAHFGAFYLKRSLMEELVDLKGACNQLVGTLSPDVRQRPDAVLREVESRFDPYGVITVTSIEDVPSHRYLADDIAGLGIFTAILPTLFLATGAIVMNVLMMRLTEQERTQIGTLKALGYGDWPLFLYYVKLAGIVGAMGGALGCLLGHLVGRILTSIFHQYFEYPTLEYRIDHFLNVLGIVLSVLVSVLGTLHGARRVVRLNPSEAMRPIAPVRGTAEWLDRFPLVRRRLSTSNRMVLRGMCRNWQRTLTAVFAVAIGTTLLLCAYIVDESLLYLLEFQYRLVSQSDVDFGLKEVEGANVLEAVRRIPSVEYVEPVLELDCTLSCGSVQKRCRITGLERTARLTIPRDARGRPVKVPESGLLLSRKLAQILRVQPGDDVTLRTVKGDRRPRRVRVVQIAEGYLGLPVYANREYLHRLVGDEASVSRVQALTKPGFNESLAMHRELKRMPNLKNVMVRSNQMRILEQTLIATFRLETKVLVLFAGVSYFSSVLNCVLISLAERRREIATLSVLGSNPWRVGTLFLRELAWGNAAGTILGLPFGFFFGWFVLQFHDTQLYRIPLAYPPAAWGRTVLLSLLFTLAGYLVVQRDILKTDWRDVLNVRE
jgi:putative ABC transport system permease protein